MQKMYNATLPIEGLFPSRWDFQSGAPANSKFSGSFNFLSVLMPDLPEHYSVGAFADSAYEYMLKQWLLSGRSEPQALELCERHFSILAWLSISLINPTTQDLKSTNAIIENLLYLTPSRKLLYVTDMWEDKPSHTLEHLSCFLPGLFALGVSTLPHDTLPKDVRERHLWAAEGLAETCWITYADTKTGLGPDEMSMEAWPHQPVPHTANPDGLTTPITATSDSTTEDPGKPNKWGKFWKGAGPEQAASQEDMTIGGRWMDHVERWEKNGREGGPKPPGARHVEKVLDPKKREWTAAKSAYLLRPEVRFIFCCFRQNYVINLGVFFRPLKASISFGRQREISNGAIGAGRCLRPSKSTQRRSMDTRVLAMSMHFRCSGRTRCQG